MLLQGSLVQTYVMVSCWRWVRAAFLQAVNLPWADLQVLKTVPVWVIVSGVNEEKSLQHNDRVAVRLADHATAHTKQRPALAKSSCNGEQPRKELVSLLPARPVVHRPCGRGMMEFTTKFATQNKQGTH